MKQLWDDFIQSIRDSGVIDNLGWMVWLVVFILGFKLIEWLERL